MKRASVMSLGSVLLLPLYGGLLVHCSSNKTSEPETESDASASSLPATTSNTTTASNGSNSKPVDGTSSGGGPQTTNSTTASSPTTSSPTTSTNDEPAESSDEPASTGDGGAVTTSGTASDSDEAVTSDTGGETSGPPPDAYVPCSGTPLPSLNVEAVLVPPKVNDPIHVSNPPGQPNMFYVAERDGAFKRFDMSEADPTATTLVTLGGVSTMGEMGFLSAALHPNFDGENEKRAYLVYTPAQSFVIQEYTIEGDTAVEGNVLFEFTGDTESNHNGGLAVFGPDGYLYVGIGDGGGGNDQHGENGNGQNTNTTYGKMLRLDVEAPTEPLPGNLTSEDVDGAMVDGRILHYGLRNPWRFTFDRLTNDLYIGDVGQNAWEEVDFIPADQGPTNFGWAAREGFSECEACGATIVGLPATEPVYDYENPAGNQETRSVTGGYVYRGKTIPGLYGRYLFADYQTGVFTVLTADGAGPACDVIEDAIQQNELRESGIASFAEDVDGEIYVVSLTDGIYKIVANP